MIRVSGDYIMLGCFFCLLFSLLSLSLSLSLSHLLLLLISMSACHPPICYASWRGNGLGSLYFSLLAHTYIHFLFSLSSETPLLPLSLILPFLLCFLPHCFLASTWIWYSTSFFFSFICFSDEAYSSVLFNVGSQCSFLYKIHWVSWVYKTFSQYHSGMLVCSLVNFRCAVMIVLEGKSFLNGVMDNMPIEWFACDTWTVIL